MVAVKGWRNCVVMYWLSTAFLHAQGTFVFANYVSSPEGVLVDAPVFDADGLPLYGTKYLAELYGGNAPDNLQPAGEAGQRIRVPFTYTVSGASGYFRYAGAVSVSTIPSGGFGWIQVRAWDAELGASYEEVAALGRAGYGASEVFGAWAGGGSANPPFPPEPLVGLRSFQLVPEPGMGLLVLGGLAILLAYHLRLRLESGVPGRGDPDVVGLHRERLRGHPSPNIGHMKKNAVLGEIKAKGSDRRKVVIALMVKSLCVRHLRGPPAASICGDCSWRLWVCLNASGRRSP
jgi:hypothetical protein